MADPKTNIALIVAAGRGQRAGEGLPKQFRNLPNQEVTILNQTVGKFLNHDKIQGVCVVIHEEDMELYQESLADLSQHPKLLTPAYGGSTRQASVFNGLDSLHPHSPDIVLIHDAARPYISPEFIERGFEAIANSAKTISGAVPVIDVTDTIKHIKNGRIVGTIDRDTVARAQTPQFFKYSKIVNAHRSVSNTSNFTDDAAIAEATKLKLVTFIGDVKNVKLTYEEDFMLQNTPTNETRTGFGFDVHAFDHAQDAEHIRLCGVDITHSKKLSGHSDADVGLHALCDAIFGALALDDIGAHFPPTFASNKDRDSSEFVAFAVEQLSLKSAKLINVDITIICEAPKVGPHRAQMRERVAELLKIGLDRVSIKATTTERLGFTGRKEGIAAQAVVNISIPAI